MLTFMSGCGEVTLQIVTDIRTPNHTQPSDHSRSSVTIGQLSAVEDKRLVRAVRWCAIQFSENELARRHRRRCEGDASPRDGPATRLGNGPPYLPENPERHQHGHGGRAPARGLIAPRTRSIVVGFT